MNRFQSYFGNHMVYYYTTQYYYYNGVIGSITGQPSGSSYSNNTGYGTYVNNSLERNFILSLGLNNGNLSGGIRSVYIRTHKAEWQLQFTPAIPKDNFKTLSFLLYHGHGFKQAPYETITEEQYFEMIKFTKPITSVQIEESDFDIQDCDNGSCPIK